MAKQLTCQRYIFKIRSSRLRKARWNLTLPLSEARKNEELVSLADSQVLRWLDELNGIENAEGQAREIKRKIKRLRKEPNSITAKKAIKQLYEELDAVQFKPDYMCLIIDREKDYLKACEGFYINGIKYRRLLGTNGGVKNKTIVFVSERHGEEIIRRIENGRDPNIPLVPAKYEAYRALACSASIPVSLPHGILVVPDCETKFLSDVIYLNDEGVDEPIMELRKNVEVELDESDGYGLMLPSLAKRWSEELGLDYLVSGVNTRFSFEKGMVFTFNFMEFADKVANKYIVKDAWGHEVDIRKVELILTTSMVKLWDSYQSCEHYLACCMENKYTFAVTKTCPKELERERALNYQFIQSYELSDEDIDELIEPTKSMIEDVLGGDIRKTILFLKGMYLNDDNVQRMENHFSKALMIDERIVHDKYVRSAIFSAIKSRIDKAKIGVLNVHGNYSIISGDPFSLCQSIFGLEVTGILKAGEIYNKYWCDTGAEKLVCFRAPMTCHNNIRAVKPNRSEEASYWYRYMTTCTILNSWDTMAHALNGADKDGDLIMLTDNRVLVDRLRETPALMCAQRKAEKRVITEESLIRANISSFGEDIGRTTNWVTSMYEVQAQYEKGSTEYEVLDYRIKSGQLYQQNSIDKAKGIVCKPMPRDWHDRHAVNMIPNPEDRRFAQSIVAERKPYFMRLIYTDLMQQYNTYIKNTNKNALREFGMTMEELLSIPRGDLTERQSDFLRYYHARMPVGMNDCVMNRVCKKLENVFNGYFKKCEDTVDFDYTLLKSGVPYPNSQYYAVLNVFEQYNKKLKHYAVFADYEKVDEMERFRALNEMKEEFRRACDMVCTNSDMLNDIILDICYKKSSTKKFAWSMCCDTIIENLLKQNDYNINYPVLDEEGDISFGGQRFTYKTQKIEVSE